MTLDTKVEDMISPLEEAGVYLSVFSATNPTKPIKSARVYVYIHQDYIEIMPTNPNYFLQVRRSVPYERTVTIPDKNETDRQIFKPDYARWYGVYHKQQQRNGEPLVCTVPTMKMKQYMRRMKREEAINNIKQGCTYWMCSVKKLGAKLAQLGRFF